MDTNFLFGMIVGAGLLGAVLCAVAIVIEIKRGNPAIDAYAHQPTRSAFDDESTDKA
jgi:hypothetical protein